MPCDTLNIVELIFKCGLQSFSETGCFLTN